VERKSVYLENATLCASELTEYCNGTSNATTIENACQNKSLANFNFRGKSLKTENDYKFNKQFVFSEYFNLFDFITSMWKNGNETNSTHQFDFIVLDFKNILNSLNASIIIWRPFLILQQNALHRNQFIMHHALSEDSWMANSTIQLWKCGPLCWGIVAAAILLMIFIIIVSSLSAGIVIR
jgi:hypothetical protein